MSSEIALPDAVATAALARRLAVVLMAGDVLALDGPMGAGKTTFTRALVEALGGDPALVSSPTYTLLHRYDGRLPVVHVDACRLTSAEALEGLGFEEASSGAVAVVEWAAQVADVLPVRRWRLNFDHDGVGGRIARIEPPEGVVWSWDPVVRIPAVAGADPLVASWLERHASHSAVRLLQGRWILVGMVAAVVGAVIARAVVGWPGTPSTARALAEAWFGDPVVVLGGMACGGLLASVVAARRRFPAGQEPLIGGVMVATAWLCLWDPLIAAGVLSSVLALIFLAAVGYRCLAVLLGGHPGLQVDGPVAPAGGWPVVTILVPLYREVEVIPHLVASLQALAYPRDRLDIQFLCEADDPETIAALVASDLPLGARVVVVPDAQPKTKPRACNHGLALARGEFLVIYDAEDRPDPDQITQAVAVFAQEPVSVACLQAHLAWRNAGDNALTRLFALEYNVWFRRYLPGLHRLGAPIPLGGTSNHFKTALLREVGGWDPFNVAEDCDLGVRLHQAGYRTALLDRTTWEEAVTEVPAWIRQRTRWFKGYLATAAVWGRRPVRLARNLGPAGTVGFFLAVPAVPLLAAIGLLSWLVLLVYGALVGIDLSHGASLHEILSQRDWAGNRWSWPLWYAGPGEHPFWSWASQVLTVVAAILVVGNVLLICLAMLGGSRSDQPGLRRWALLMPCYWLLQGVAAWRALLHAVLSPHRWEKTIHHRPPGA